MTADAGIPRNPLIVLCAPEHADVLESQFARYAFDYDLRVRRRARPRPSSCSRRCPPRTTWRCWSPRPSCPTTTCCSALHAWRAAVPTARRIIAAHVDHFRERADELRHGLATGKYDAYLLMPRGVRDEEFHTAVTELLSDWGSTAPVVPTVQHRLRPAGPAHRRAARLRLPDGHAGRRWSRPTPRRAARCSPGTATTARFPVVSALGGITTAARVRARRSRRPSTAPPTRSTSTRSSTSSSWAPDRPAWPPPSTAPPRGSRPWSSSPTPSAARPAPAR